VFVRSTCALLLVCLVSCRAPRAADPASATLTVAVAKVAIQSLSRQLVLTAEFKPFQEVDVMSKVAGYVRKIDVDTGDRVRQGQLLATLEIPELADELAKADASLERSQAEVARSHDDIRRAESAHTSTHLSYERLTAVNKERPGLVAQQEIDDAQGKDLVAEAQVAAAKSSLSVALQQVSVSKAEQQKCRTLIDYTRVTAPFAGVVTKRFADTGSMIQAGTASQTQAMPLVRLSENSLLRLILPVPESAVPLIHVGQHVEVKVPSLNRSFPGRVARFSDKLQSSTRTMEKLDNALAVPVTAVDMEGDTAAGTVMVVNSQQILERRSVALGLETATRIEVRSGVRDGELVVVGSRSGLRAGDRVNPKITTLVAKDEQ
jgi:RND family efflux transporter MFP subunit